MSKHAADAHHSATSSLRTGPAQDDRPSLWHHTTTHSSSGGGHQRRPVPSPLQQEGLVCSESDGLLGSPTAPKARGAPNSSGLLRNPVAQSQDAVAQLDVERSRPSAMKAAANPAVDEIRAGATRDALRKKAATVDPTSRVDDSQPLVARNVSAAVLSPAAELSPHTSPNMPTTSKTLRPDPWPTMPRQSSRDSTVSTASNASQPSKSGGFQAYRVSQENGIPQDVPSIIAAAGSAEAAIQKLIAERQSAASHNAQLWRLVEKQRSMILGLNKDLEKTHKEKERYRGKLKDNLVASSPAPSLSAAAQQNDDLNTRETSQSPAQGEHAEVTTRPRNVGDISLDSRKIGDASDMASIEHVRAETPQDNSVLPSSGLPATPQSANSIAAPVRVDEKGNGIASSGLPLRSMSLKKGPKPAPLHRVPFGAPPISPNARNGPNSPANDLVTTDLSPPATNTSFSSPKGQRKAPPAPLKLNSPLPTEIVDASDSEYEDNEETLRAEAMERGRRKTREEDDHEREMTAVQEEEHRSRSKKSKKSKSNSKPSDEKPHVPEVDEVPAVEPSVPDSIPPPSKRAELVTHQPVRDSSAPTRQRAESDVPVLVNKTVLAPMLMSPGLPMSPRPGDRPFNSPMPRAPMKAINSIPMSPRAGMAGLPLSPRAPRQPLPIVPQTPLTFASPHLARAEAYHQQATQQGSLADRLKSTSQPSAENERPSTSSDGRSIEGEIFQGFVTEQYHDFLLPPNALPSILIKVASSRMRPSRQSYIAPRLADENTVFTLAVYARSDTKQLWRIEKTLASLSVLDQRLKSGSSFREPLPDRGLFSGHAPAKIDHRRAALADYFDRMLDTVMDEKAAKIVCKFLSSDAIGAEATETEYFPTLRGRSDAPSMKGRPGKDGYLTKRGKNFGGWKARYFVLDGPKLNYYESPGGPHLGSIKLQNARIGKQSQQQTQLVDEDVDNQYRHAFLILEPKKKDSSALVRHVLCAENDEERDVWVDALLQYVDYRDEEDEVAARPPMTGTSKDSGLSRKSTNDLIPLSRGKDNAQPKPMDGLRALGYGDTIAGEAPVIGPPSARGTPSPPFNSTFPGTPTTEAPPSHAPISAPKNGVVIQDAGSWGNKPPPTPGNAKDKKRGIFGFRGRSSLDLATNPPNTGNPLHHSRRDQSEIRAVFGVPLAEAVEFAHPADTTTELPAVVYRCIEYLTVKNAITEEGIFRLSGSNTVIKALRERFNTEGDVNLAAEDKYYDVHAVASLLKLYLRELPSSILTRDLHLEFLRCLELDGHVKVEAFNVLVHRLPGPNRGLLEALSAFLREIVDNERVNKMNVRNVGIVFAPTLNVPAPLISLFVTDFDTIFGDSLSDTSSPVSIQEIAAPLSNPADAIRSPRKQMFTDLPTPAYNQTTFQSFGYSQYHVRPMHQQQQQQQMHDQFDTGMIPMRPTYATPSIPQMASQHGGGNFGSLNDALASSSPAVSAFAKETKSKRRESGLLGANVAIGGMQKKSSM